MRTSGSGSSKLITMCVIIFCLALSGCVKRAPRPEQPPEQAEKAKRPKTHKAKCGLICRIKQQLKEDAIDRKQKRIREGHPAEEKKSRQEKAEKKEPKKEDKKPGKSWPWQKKEEETRQKERKGPGVYHTVKKGETFYRICKTYGVDLNQVAEVNQIHDPTQLSVGQQLWIPGAEKVLEVPSAPVSEKTPPPVNSAANKPAAAPPPAAKGTFINPVPGGRISSGFGMRNDRMHEGIDICAPQGTPVLAAEDGKVVYEGDDIRGYGNMIIVKHAGDLRTVYAHNSKNLVHNGDMVKQGQKIAAVGQTGRATATHLHFEVRIGEKPVNPEFYLP